MEAPTTLLEAVRLFSDKQVAHDYFVKQRFPNGVACPRMGCGSADVAPIKNRNAWRCRECNRQFTAKVGTIFEDSPIGFDKWLPVMWMLTNCRNGISSYEVARGVGVTQKTAWFMLHRPRLAMRADGGEMLTGEVEADETFIGGRVRSTMRRPGQKQKFLAHGPATGKTTVFGMVQRGPNKRVRAIVVPDHKRASLLPRLKESVAPGSILDTDALRSYRGIPEYQHAFVDHMVEYVNGRVHTNTIENFWSCLKRMVKGTYICPRPFHMDAYVDEQAFRFNVREESDPVRFDQALRGADGKRVTWVALTTSHPLWRLKPGRASHAGQNI